MNLLIMDCEQHRVLLDLYRCSFLFFPTFHSLWFIHCFGQDVATLKPPFTCLPSSSRFLPSFPGKRPRRWRLEEQPRWHRMRAWACKRRRTARRHPHRGRRRGSTRWGRRIALCVCGDISEHVPTIRSPLLDTHRRSHQGKASCRHRPRRQSSNRQPYVAIERLADQTVKLVTMDS